MKKDESGMPSEGSLDKYDHNQESQMGKNTRELMDALERLEKTQATLIQSEKLAAIGQLVSGIAHEINTPLGAINSSVGNMSNTLERLYSTLPESLRALQEEGFSLFLKLISNFGKTNFPLNSREEMAERNRLRHELKGVESEYLDLVVDILGDMGIYDENILEGIEIGENTVRILELALMLVIMTRSVETIRTAVTRASSVVNALKNVSRMDGAGPLMPYDLTEGIEMTLTLFQNRIKRGIEVIRDMQQIPLVECNPDEVNQVWTNLIRNGLQAMDLDGVLTVQTRLAGDRVRIGIGDTGKGIDKEVKDRIFEPFFTTKSLGEGTGLGLDISRRIIEKLGGTITFESVPGNTWFYVEIPLEQSKD